MRSAQQSNFDTRHMVTRVSATNVFSAPNLAPECKGSGETGRDGQPCHWRQPPILTDLKGQSRTRRNTAERLFPLFKTGALNRSATHPGCACYSARGGWYRCRLPP